MSKAKVTPKAARKRRRKMSGSALTVWHAVFFVSGVVAMGLFQYVLISTDHTRSGHQADRTATSPPGASAPRWGELEITPMLLDRPEAHFETNTAPAPALHWTFPNFSPPQLAQFISCC